MPSCQICNSRFKLEENDYGKEHLYPYTDEFGDDAKFEIDAENIKQLMGIEADKIKINVENDPYQKIEKSVRIFHLKKVYQSHGDYVQELIKKSILYNDSQIDEFLSKYPGMFSSENEILRIVFGNYVDKADLGKRPLAKLTRDILEELGVDLKMCTIV